MDVLSLKNPAFGAFLFYSGVVLMKIVLMSVLTSFYRITKKVFVNPEDVREFIPGSKGQEKKFIITNDSMVDRTKRIHLNDIENILPFFMLGFLYLYTQPSAAAALLCYRAFAVSRLLHFISYFFVIRQPARGLCFGVGFTVNVYMAYCVITTFSKFM